MARVEPVASSVLEAVGYDGVTRTLVLAFTSGAVYAYDDVEPHVHAELLAAPSLGRYFSSRIRDRYPTRRLG